MTSAFKLKPQPAQLLVGRKALVTGGDSGIGQGIAYELAAHGAAVAINYLGDPTVATQMADEINSAEGKAITVKMNIANESEVIQAFDQVNKSIGKIDLLVNNAGIEKPFPLVDMPLDWWQRVIDVNLTGTFLCSREAARGMMREKTKGSIINITSVHEQIPWKQYSHYCASKGGEKMFTQSIARELAPHGIRVLSVAPGAIETPINKQVLANRAQRKAVEDEIPLCRWGTVEDVARTVAWLASSQADYIVGSTVFVDGGMILYPEFV